jgi:hypothetical protein
MPDIRTSCAHAAEQAMTIPQRVKAALKAAERFEVGSTVYLPDRAQTLRVVAVDFTRTKGNKATFAWLRWESECVVCGAAYQFTTKRVFDYPTRTCPDHRRTSRRKAAPLTPKAENMAAPTEAMRRAAADVLTGFSLVDDRVLIRDAQVALQRALYGAELPRSDPRVRGIWAALAGAMESGAAPGVPGDEDILFVSPLP